MFNKKNEKHFPIVNKRSSYFIYDKKADTHMWWIIIVAAIALIISVLLLIWFKGSGESAFDTVNKNLAGAGDCDGDKAPDLFDKCPCDSNVQEKLPSGTTECPKKCSNPMNKVTDCITT